VTLIAVARDKFAKGDGPAVYEQVELVEALERVYRSDAHLVGYVVGDGPMQSRLTKSSATDQAVTTTVFVDVDNPGHAPWTPEATAAALERYRALPLPAGVYHTAHGARFVLPLASPVPVLEAEALIRRALTTFAEAGVAVDWAARDWTRHFRCPHVVRAGRAFTSPLVDLSRMRPVELEPLDLPAPERAPRARRAARVIPFTPTLAAHWQARAEVIGRAACAPGALHALYLAVAGALLAKGIPPEHVPELVRLAAMAGGSTDPAHHARSAEDTVRRWAGGASVTGMRELSVRWPAVADAVHDALADAVVVHVAEVPPPSDPPPAALTLEETTAALERAIAHAPDGATVIVAECGLGKTFAAQRVAKQRAERRKRLQSKTSIAVDKNELALQIARDLERDGVPVRRLFGPLSVRGADGELACKYASRALPLVNGGQSVRWEFCEGRGRYRCEHYDTCPAKDGEVGEGKVTVGTHALIAELDAAAGSTGLLVIDEPPPALEAFTFKVDDVDVALGHLAYFDRAYAAAMGPVLLALRAWDNPDVIFDDLAASLERPPPDMAKPPLLHYAVRQCKADVRLATNLGAASHVLRSLYRAMTDAEATVRLELEPTRVVVTSPRPELARALRREGAVVLLDANADVQLPAYAKLLAYTPPVHRFTAPDGAPIDRTMLRCGSATRRSWLAHGRLVTDTGLLVALRAVRAWYPGGTVGIITMRQVEIAIAAALGRDHSTAGWGSSAKHLAEVAAEVREALEGVDIVELAHYGATRGLNRMANVDCLVTLGDPWPSVSDAQAEATYLGDEAGWEDRLEAKCRAELEQAHGRLRVVHRTRPGFALHVGRVLPGGSGWASARTESLAGGRPRAGAPMPPSELAEAIQRAGGVRALARAVGCAAGTISKYQAGRGVPPAVASLIRALCTVSETPIAGN